MEKKYSRSRGRVKKKKIKGINENKEFFFKWKRIFFKRKIYNILGWEP